MTEKSNPSVNRPIEAFKTAGVVALAGGMGDGFVFDGASPTELAKQDSNISHTALNTFAETHSATSFDVTIDAGESMVYGSWLAKDTSTTVTLASSTTNQTVYVGWNKNGSNDVIIGTASAFASASGDTDMKIPLWDFDTDGSGVTASTDRRLIGKPFTIDARGNLIPSLNLELPNGNIQKDGTLTIGNGGGGDVVLRDGFNGLDIIRANQGGAVNMPNGQLSVLGQTVQPGKAVPISITHASWEAGLSNEEIWRIKVPSGKSLEIHSLDVQFKGGGGSTSFDVEAYDATAAASLVTDTAGGGPTTGNPAATSGAGNIVILRLTNSTGAKQTASISGSFYLV